MLTMQIDDVRCPADVASALSPAMRRGVLMLPSDGAWMDRYHARPNTVERLIYGYGLLDTVWDDERGCYRFRLNGMGRQVRARLDAPSPPVPPADDTRPAPGGEAGL